MDEIKSTDCLGNRIHLDRHSTTTLQGRGISPDGSWAISHAEGKGTGSRRFHQKELTMEAHVSNSVYMWLQPVRTAFVVEKKILIENLNENLNEVLPEILIFDEVLDEVLDFDEVLDEVLDSQ